MIDITKSNNPNNNTENTNSRIIEEMADEILKICELLSVKNDDFDNSETFIQICNYVQKYDRLLYANISAYCYEMSPNNIDNFIGNIFSLVSFSQSAKYEDAISELKSQGKTENVQLFDRTKRIILKLYDHINLACNQINDLRKSDEDLEILIQKQFSPFKEEIIKEMSTQLISLVAIFTAVAFVVFGGFTSLSSIFSNFSQNSYKLILIVTLWGLAICNVIFILMYCIGYIIRISSTESNYMPVVSLKLVKWTNLILITGGLLSGWLYFIDLENLGGGLVSYIKNHEMIFSPLGVVVILLLFIITATIMAFKEKSKKKTNKH